MKPAQALLLDLSETLVDGSVAREAISRTCDAIAASRPGLDAATLVEANTKIWPGYWREVGDRWELGQIDSQSLGLEAWRRTLRACGCNDESVAQLATQTLLKLSRNGYRLFDDVTDLLAAARRAGVPLGLITNGAADTQREKLRILDLERWFEVDFRRGWNRKTRCFHFPPRPRQAGGRARERLACGRRPQRRRCRCEGGGHYRCLAESTWTGSQAL